MTLSINRAEITTGDTRLFPVQLKDAGTGAGFNIDGASTVTACLVTSSRLIKLAGDWTCLSGATGADWSTSLVVVPIAGADTTAIADASLGLCKMAIQVDDGISEITYYADVSTVKGHLT